MNIRRAALILFSAAMVAGCAGNIVVNPLPSPGVLALDARDTAKLMKCAGFADKQIIENGAELRNALASTGAARLTLDDSTEALFAVVDNKIHVSTRWRGSFIYEKERGVCR